MNWKEIIEQNYSQKSTTLKIDFLTTKDSKFEKDANITITSTNGELQISIWSDSLFNKLYDITFIFAKERNNFTRHFEGMKYSPSNQKFLKQLIDPFIFDGWNIIKHSFILTYKTEILNYNKTKFIGPSSFWLFSPLIWTLSLAGLLSKRKATFYHPIINLKP